jgi:hypothetical protein
MWSQSLTRREKYSVAALSFLTFALRIPLAFRPAPELGGLPYTDDAFYLFSIARNLAKGLGPTVDGTHLTNGFQPLILLFYTPIFWFCGADSWLAVRWTFVLNGMIAALTVCAVALFLRTIERQPQTRGASPTMLTAPIAGAALWTCTFQIFSEMTNGLETGLTSLLLFIALTLYATLEKNVSRSLKIPIVRWIGFGAMLGLAVLARIDAAMFVAIVVIVLMVQQNIREAFATGLSALLVSAPWWTFNWVTFGSLMPSSGQAENSWPMPKWENIERAVKSISDIFSLVFYVPGKLGPILRSIWAVVFIATIILVSYRTKLLERLRASFRLGSLIPLLLFSLALLLYYTFFFRAPHFIDRYLQPGRMAWSVFIAIAASVFWREKIARWIIVGIAIVGVVFSINGYLRNNFPARQTYDFYNIGVWANNHPDEKIGMLQSGIASFIAPNIINLDGKVNTDALRAHQQGRLAAYLRDEHFTYIADWKPFIADIDTIAQKNELYFDSVGMVGSIQLMKLRGR